MRIEMHTMQTIGNNSRSRRSNVLINFQYPFCLATLCVISLLSMFPCPGVFIQQKKKKRNRHKTHKNYYYYFIFVFFCNENNKMTKKTNIYGTPFGYRFSFGTVASSATSSMHYVLRNRLVFMNRIRCTRDRPATQWKYESIPDGQRKEEISLKQ